MSTSNRFDGSSEMIRDRGTSTRRFRRLMLSAALAALVTAPAAAQVPAPPQATPIALTGATIHTVTNGVIENGTIVFANGVITAIGGSDVAVPAGAQRVDATGKHIYPGLIDGHSAMGLAEIGAVDVTNDTDELGDFTPNVRAELAFHPESRHIGTARSNGVLVTLSTPEGGLVSGLSAAMMLDGWTWETMTVKSGAALNVSWPDPDGDDGNGWGGGDDDDDEEEEPSYEEQIRELRNFFARARAYRDAQAAGTGYDTDARFAAMVPALNGEVPVIVDANSVQQIQDAIAWAEAEDVRIIVRGGEDALYVADHLAARQIPVLLTTVMDGPNRDWEPIDGNYALPAKLHERGVRFAITGGSSAPYTHRLPWEAGVAVAYGLPADEALRAVTIYPATFLGIDDRVGSLETGKDATLLITTGNPLDFMANIEQAYVQGREIDMMDAFKELFEKYSEKLRQIKITTDRD